LRGIIIGSTDGIEPSSISTFVINWGWSLEKFLITAILRRALFPQMPE
jgi:hypothetical protein